MSVTIVSTASRTNFESIKLSAEVAGLEIAMSWLKHCVDVMLL